MKSPQIVTVIIVAFIFAIIGYFVAGVVGVEPLTTAISLLIGAGIAPFISFPQGAPSLEEQDIKTLYVGNLPYRANESAVRELFSEHGFVHSVRLMKDKHTGKRRGFGFVEMSASNINNVISALNDMEFQQRTLKVREAKERQERTDNNE